MKTKILGLSIVCFLSLMISCKEEDEPSKIDLVTRTDGWGFVSFKLDNVEQLEACDLDNVMKFAKDKTYTINPGSNLCSVSDAIESNTWDLYGDNSELLNIKTDNSNIDYTILELTSTSLKIQNIDNNGTLVLTFVGL